MARTILAIAGSDSGGGAGVELDVRMIGLFGFHPTTALTAVTAQDAGGIHRIHYPPPRFLAAQLGTVLRAMSPAAVKVGMLGREQSVGVVATQLRRNPPPVLVVDPIRAAKDGTTLISPRGFERLVRDVIPLATVVTPNLPEAEALLGETIPDLDAARRALPRLGKLGAGAVVLKGGHLPGPAVDLLLCENRIMEFESPRLEGPPVHGTGCCYSTALACLLAGGWSLPDACGRARALLQAIIAAGAFVGQGNRVALLHQLPSHLFSFPHTS